MMIRPQNNLLEKQNLSSQSANNNTYNENESLHSQDSQQVNNFQQSSPPQQQYLAHHHQVQQQTNRMLLPPHQNSLLAWQQSAITQPSDPALQRLGLNRRLSARIQRLPSLSSIHPSSPSSAPISPNGTNINDNSQISYPLNQQPYTSNNSSPEKPLFKNIWGFTNYDNQVSPTDPNPNSNPSLPIQSQNRMHSIAGIPQFSNTYTMNSSKLSVSPNRLPTNGQNLKLSTITNDTSPHYLPHHNLRSNSIAISKSKFNMTLPTTYESSNPDFQQSQPYQQQQHQQQQQSNHLQQKQEYSAYQQQIPSDLLYRRLSQQYEPNSTKNFMTRPKYVLESQQQQIIPPLRAENPVHPPYLNNNNFNDNNKNVFHPLRRESVAAVYHQSTGPNVYYPIDSMNTTLNNITRQPSDVSMTSVDEIRDNFIYDEKYNAIPGFYSEDNHLVKDYYDVENDLRPVENNQLSQLQYDLPYSTDDNNKFQFKESFLLPVKRSPKFTKVNSINDLHPTIHEKPKYRRVSSSQEFVSPLRALTVDLSLSYSLCVPEFDYRKSKNPRRVLTKNNKPFHNNGYDNESYDYILYVNDILGTEENKKYLVLDILGQGTFGQVVKCQNLKTQEIVAVKVVKARQECLQQSIAEGNILEYLTKKVDPKYAKYFVHLKDKFMHKYHLCLVFDLLSSNLYELIKQNHHHGLKIKLIKNFAVQILESLCALKDIKLIHCDLKPENILLTTLNKPNLKIIDFGSACQERQTIYTYVQSRFYRSPEVILGVEYSTSVDMWSFGCIVAELFLGLPLFPGVTEFEQLVRIVETFGMPPSWMMVEKKSSNYVVKLSNKLGNGRSTYRLKTLDEFNKEFNLNESPPKQYFSDTKLDDIILNYRLPKKNMTEDLIDIEMQERSCLIHFLKGVLNISPLERWTPYEAIHHPFITGERWLGSWSPPTEQFGNPNKGNIRSNSLM
jgi:dual specificity protein kinase YAK1